MPSVAHTASGVTARSPVLIPEILTVMRMAELSTFKYSARFLVLLAIQPHRAVAHPQATRRIVGQRDVADQLAGRGIDLLQVRRALDPADVGRALQCRRERSPTSGRRRPRAHRVARSRRSARSHQGWRGRPVVGVLVGTTLTRGRAGECAAYSTTATTVATAITPASVAGVSMPRSANGSLPGRSIAGSALRGVRGAVPARRLVALRRDQASRHLQHRAQASAGIRQRRLHRALGDAHHRRGIGDREIHEVHALHREPHPPGQPGHCPLQIDGGFIRTLHETGAQRDSRPALDRARYDGPDRPRSRAATHAACRVARPTGCACATPASAPPARRRHARPARRGAPEVAHGAGSMRRDPLAELALVVDRLFPIRSARMTEPDNLSTPTRARMVGSLAGRRPSVSTVFAMVDTLRMTSLDFDQFHREELPARLAAGNGALAADDARLIGPLAIRTPAGRSPTCPPTARSTSSRATSTAKTVIALDDDVLAGPRRTTSTRRRACSTAAASRRCAATRCASCAGSRRCGRCTTAARCTTPRSSTCTASTRPPRSRWPTSPTHPTRSAPSSTRAATCSCVTCSRPTRSATSSKTPTCCATKRARATRPPGGDGRERRHRAVPRAPRAATGRALARAARRPARPRA